MVGLDMEFIPLFIKNMPLIFSVSGIVVGIFLNKLIDILCINKVLINLDLIIPKIYPQHLSGLV